ncbi:MAG: DUF2500 domain-containing protein [Clostridiales bacterium]|nr:DUF2500 domain-containing protein [Clostridiales bacterium]
MQINPFGGFGVLFGVVPVLVVAGFVVVLGIIIWRAVLGAKAWKRNNDSPVLTVDAAVVTKREDVSQYQMNQTDIAERMYSSSTRYFVTFEVPSGDRMEFHVPAGEYGMLAEGDRGLLTFQGTRFIGFARQKDMDEGSGDRRL